MAQQYTYPLEYYIYCFQNMNCARMKGQVAPHKSMMLLAVMRGIELRELTNGFVPVNERMKALFENCWKKYVGDSPVFNPVFSTPFFHLDYEPFWTLLKRPEWEEKREYSSFQTLRKNYFGAMMPGDLWEYMMNDSSRKLLRRALLEKYIPEWTPEEKGANPGIVAESDERNDEHRYPRDAA